MGFHSGNLRSGRLLYGRKRTDAASQSVVVGTDPSRPEQLLRVMFVVHILTGLVFAQMYFLLRLSEFLFYYLHFLR